MLSLDNLGPAGALKWKLEDCRSEMSRSVVWKVDNSKVVTPLVLVRD
jgi:hypothetical protein